MVLMKITDINSEIVAGKLDSDLDSLVQAIRFRRDQIAQAMKWSLKAGDPVRLVGNIRPKYLAFATAKVSKVNLKKIVIDLDRPAGRFFKNVTVPVTLVEKV
jgi:hypothetical protein